MAAQPWEVALGLRPDLTKAFYKQKACIGEAYITKNLRRQHLGGIVPLLIAYVLCIIKPVSHVRSTAESAIAMRDRL